MWACLLPQRMAPDRKSRNSQLHRLQKPIIQPGFSCENPPRITRNKSIMSAKESLAVNRVFSSPEISPFDQVTWEKRSTEITDEKGKTIFKQDEVEVPSFWSQLATKVVVSKYFYGEQGTSEREKSVRQLVHRVCRTITDWGIKDGYFTKKDGEVFYDELVWLCVNQYAAFNSPVWFNVGLYQQYGVGKNSTRGNWVTNKKTGTAERAATQ